MSDPGSDWWHLFTQGTKSRLALFGKENCAPFKIVCVWLCLEFKIRTPTSELESRWKNQKTDTRGFTKRSRTCWCSRWWKLHLWHCLSCCLVSSLDCWVCLFLVPGSWSVLSLTRRPAVPILVGPLHAIEENEQDVQWKRVWWWEQSRHSNIIIITIIVVVVVPIIAFIE